MANLGLNTPLFSSTGTTAIGNALVLKPAVTSPAPSPAVPPTAATVGLSQNEANIQMLVQMSIMLLNAMLGMFGGGGGVPANLAAPVIPNADQSADPKKKADAKGDAKPPAPPGVPAGLAGGGGIPPAIATLVPPGVPVPIPAAPGAPPGGARDTASLIESLNHLNGLNAADGVDLSVLSQHPHHAMLAPFYAQYAAQLATTPEEKQKASEFAAKEKNRSDDLMFLLQFNNIAKADGNAKLSVKDIQAIAALDGNVKDVSAKDIELATQKLGPAAQLPMTPAPPTPPAAPLPAGSKDVTTLVKALYQLDNKERTGAITKDQIAKQIASSQAKIAMFQKAIANPAFAQFLEPSGVKEGLTKETATIANLQFIDANFAKLSQNGVLQIEALKAIAARDGDAAVLSAQDIAKGPPNAKELKAKAPAPAPVGPPGAPPAAKPGETKKAANGKIVGDPHFVGLEGEKYDVMGNDKKFYNILSDNVIQYNARFDAYEKYQKGGTVIGQAGIQVGTDRIFFDRYSKVPTFNGEPMTPGQRVPLPGSIGGNGFVEWDGAKVTVNSGEYTIVLGIGAKDGEITSDVRINEGGAFADGIMPHGLLGQTADGVQGLKNNGQDLGKQGGTVIDGSVDDYEVSDIWGVTANAYNRFTLPPPTAPPLPSPT